MLSSLQVGRALAALAVVTFHLSTALGDSRYGGETVFSYATKRGNLGVDFFFVLSGFIILHAHKADLGVPAMWRRYMHRRFIRLYPIYWIYTLGLTVLLIMGFGTVARLPETSAGWFSAIALIRVSTEPPPLGVAWTLFHELAFYVLFSLAILNRRLGFAAMALWGLICIVAYQYPETSNPTPLAVYTAAYNLNFFLGMGAHWLYERGKGAWLMLVAGALAFVTALASEYSGLHSPPILYGMSFALMIAGASILERRGHLSFPWLLRRLGDASYTLYLIHVPVTGLLLKITMGLGIDRLLGRELLYFVVLSATAACAILAYTLIEKPLLNRLRGSLRRREVPVVMPEGPGLGHDLKP
jgi:peptidoglycan/LPS O-acetylase OafA/YrhL